MLEKRPELDRIRTMRAGAEFIGGVKAPINEIFTLRENLEPVLPGNGLMTETLAGIIASFGLKFGEPAVSDPIPKLQA